MARPSYDKFSANIYASIKDRYDNNIKGYFITMNDKESSYIHNELGNDNVKSLNTLKKIGRSSHLIGSVNLKKNMTVVHYGPMYILIVF